MDAPSRRRPPAPPKPPQTLSLTSRGQDIALSVWSRGRGASTVVFLPGTLASPLLYADFLQELWYMGLNVVGVHPVGHGLSARPAVFTLDDLVGNALDAAAWARETLGGPVIASGHSQGGIVALAHALRDATLAAAMPVTTLIPTHQRAVEVTRLARLAPHREALLRGLGALARRFPTLPVVAPLYLPLARAFAGAQRARFYPGEVRKSYPLAFVHSLFTAPQVNADGGRRLTCPLTVFAACNDALFPPALLRDMLAAVDAPQKRLVLLSGGGHLAPLCPRPAAELARRMAQQCAALGLPLHCCGLPA